MSTNEALTTLPAGDVLIYRAQIDADLSITDRERRNLIAKGVIPPPDGYFVGRAFWRASTYAAFKRLVLAGKHGRMRRAGAIQQERSASG